MSTCYFLYCTYVSVASSDCLHNLLAGVGHTSISVCYIVTADIPYSHYYSKLCFAAFISGVLHNILSCPPSSHWNRLLTVLFAA